MFIYLLCEIYKKMKVITLTTVIFICSLNFVLSQTEPE